MVHLRGRLNEISLFIHVLCRLSCLILQLLGLFLVLFIVLLGALKEIISYRQRINNTYIWGFLLLADLIVFDLQRPLEELGQPAKLTAVIERIDGLLADLKQLAHRRYLMDSLLILPFEHLFIEGTLYPLLCLPACLQALK